MKDNMDINELNNDIPSETYDSSNSSEADIFQFIDTDDEAIPDEITPKPEPVTDDNDYVPVQSKKKPSKKDFIRYGILVIAIGVFIFSAYNLISIFANYKKGDDEYKNVENQVFNPTDTSIEPPTVLVNSDVYEDIFGKDNDEYEFLNYNHNKLLSINPNAQGYLDMAAYNVVVPIVQGGDNSFYLDHSITSAYHSYGCPFIDYRIEGGIEARNAIIYGHAMKNGSMFGMLNRYLRKDFYFTKNNRYMYLYCESGVYIYEVFSAYVGDSTDSRIYTLGYDDDAAFLDYINYIKGKSAYDTGVTVDATDKIITLSTCYYNDGGDRVLVHAKRLK